MHSSIISLGTIGSFELIIVLGVLLLMAAGVVLVILTVLQILKSVKARSGSPSRPADGPAACPRCGTSVPADAPQGLCPRCVMQVGLGTEDGAEPAFKDASGKPNPPDPEELARHFPNLEVIGLLGQGGMGAVYKARQKDLDRLVALKVLPGGAGSDPAFAERFMREARALARLNHPGIVAVHDFGEVGGGTGLEPVSGVGEAAADGNTGRRPVPLYYFVMEFIDGSNLRELMHGQKLSPREAMSIVPKICEALQFAHDEGIVHRDIKPENILVDKKGRVKIADFGIAKIVGKGRDATLTGAKDVIGTPHYMAPEQVEKPTEVDHRADIYSLGVVFYELLTGELPLGKFEPPSSRMRGIQVDVRLDEVVLRSLAKAPERRYQHASEVKTDVETIAAGAEKSELRVQNAEGEADRQSSAARAANTRYSRLAVIGACWAAIAILCAVLSNVGINVGVLLPLNLLGVLALGAPFGTTICGAIALSQIRRSAGKLCGLGLALFDALLFPLLVLDGGIIWLVFLLMGQIHVWVGFNPRTEPTLESVLLPVTLVVPVVNVWLVRRAWRSAKRMQGRVPTAEERESAGRWTRIAVPVSAVLLISAAALMVVTPLQVHRRAEALKTKQQAELEEIKYTARLEHERTVTTAPDPIAAPTRVPPVVVRTQPESGSRTVSSALTELRVSFSKPMQDGNWSWVKLDEETFPEMAGQPGFIDDGRTCVLPVKLQPGKTYATWINVDSFQNFQDRNGNPALPYLLVFTTKE